MPKLRYTLTLWRNCQFTFQTSVPKLPTNARCPAFDHAVVQLDLHQANGVKRFLTTSLEFPGFVPVTLDPGGAGQFTLPGVRAALGPMQQITIRKTCQMDVDQYATLCRRVRGIRPNLPNAWPLGMATWTSVHLAMAATWLALVNTTDLNQLYGLLHHITTQRSSSFYRLGAVTTPEGATQRQVGFRGGVNMYQDRHGEPLRAVGVSFPLGDGSKLAAYVRGL